jgi:hypothetical protein
MLIMQRVGSSGKNLDLGGIPFMFKVRISLSINNFLEPRTLVKLESYPICLEGCFARVRGLPIIK